VGRGGGREGGKGLADAFCWSGGRVEKEERWPPEKKKLSVSQDFCGCGRGAFRLLLLAPPLEGRGRERSRRGDGEHVRRKESGAITKAVPMAGEEGGLEFA